MNLAQLSGKRTFEQRSCLKCGNLFTPESGTHRYCKIECRAHVTKTKCWNYGHICTRINSNPLRFFSHLIKKYDKMGVGSKGYSRRELTPQFLHSLFKEQSGLCAISGIPMRPQITPGGHPHTCSIDRIDNALGYLSTNVQLVCKSINVSRMDQSVHEFITLCKQVANYQDALASGASSKVSCSHEL